MKSLLFAKNVMQLIFMIDLFGLAQNVEINSKMTIGKKVL